MKRILMIGTGGTIASRGSEAGLTPQMTSEDILRYIPQCEKLCQIDSIQICNLDSTNISSEHWLLMAEAIKSRYDAYDGFVICHGTDTMAYSAAALSYLIQNSPKPIVLTGAQKPIDMEITDSKTNLYDSFLYAVADESCGVQIVFNGHVILGTRARKTRSKSFDAFSSVNYPDLASIQDGRLIRYIPQQEDNAPRFYDGLNAKVALLKLIPGMDAEVLAFMLERNDAVIIESYGVGGIPLGEGTKFNEVIHHYTGLGRTIVMSTQVPNEGSDMMVYQVGYHLKDRCNILEAFDMTTEAVVTKLMWILGQTKEPNQVREMFYQAISKDILYTE